jgi:hypothetical protein
MNKLLIALICIAFVSCKKADTNYESNSTTTESNYQNSDYHESSSVNTVNSTSYSSSDSYSYDVSGSDSNGNGVNGYIDVDRNGGSGTIEDENGNEVDVDVEWTGKGTLEATDSDGNSYELDVD